MTSLYAMTKVEPVAQRWPPLLRLLWRLEAAVLGAFWAFMAVLPAGAASEVGARLMRLIGPRLRKSSHVRRNLALAFPELDGRRREALVAGVWSETGRVLAEYPHLSRILDEVPGAHLEIVRDEAFERARELRKAAIFVTAHVGNWELAAGVAARLGHPCTAVYNPPPNPFIHRMLQRQRRQLGCRFIDKRAGVMRLARELREGRHLGLLLDQRVDGGEMMPFFGVDAETTLVPALLSLRTGCDLTPVRIERLGAARFRLRVYRAIAPDPSLGQAREQAREMTNRLLTLFESWIRECPESWFCTKRRWPKSVEPGRVAPRPSLVTP
ncbi:MAG: lysophospholipid acyltransferase family protein [Geminicoccaceae bacterium]